MREGGRGNGWCKWRGGGVITFNATKNGKVTKNLSLVWGGSEGFEHMRGRVSFFLQEI